MAHLHAKDDSDVTAFSLSYDSDKYLLDVSPTTSEFPEIPNTTVPIAEHNKPSPRRREDTLDPSKPPSVIPQIDPDPKKRRRTLVLCFDGTGDQFDADNSNIVKLVSLLKKDDSANQLVYYQAGIGTYDTDSNSTALMSAIRKLLDEMVAWSIDDHVIAGYKFLMQNYKEGDKICLFGFSRGAYTARSLAGMLRKVGLLPLGNLQQVPFAYRMYKRVGKHKIDQSKEFKSSFSMDVPIEFIGVWDTVSSLGAIRRRSLPVTTACTNAKTFRHALSLDERRARFQAHFWKEKKNDHTEVTNNNDEMPPIKTDVEEVWFAGCHCDVGGGSVSNKTRHSLARIPLRWMIRECFKTNSGILFNSQSLHSIGLDPSTLYPTVTPRPSALPIGPNDRIQNPPVIPIPIDIRALYKKQEKDHDLLKRLKCDGKVGTEEEEERHDALSPKYDQLSIKKFWWILEIIPLRPHLGSPRIIPHEKLDQLKVHRSVLMRSNAEYESRKKKGKKYTPKAHFDVEPIYVD